MKISKFFIIICIAFLSLPINLWASLPILKITANIENPFVYLGDEKIGRCTKGKLEVEIDPGRYNLILKTNDEINPLLYSEYIHAKMDNKIEVTATLTLKRAEEYYYKNINNYKDKKQFLKMFPRSKHLKKIENQILEFENQYDDDDIATLKSKIRKKLNPDLILISALDKTKEFTKQELRYEYSYLREPINIQFLYNDYPNIAQLDAFYIGKYEVTDLFYDFVSLVDNVLSDKTKLLQNIEEIEKYLSMDIFKSKPKNEVTWYEAIRFCDALSKIHDLSPFYESAYNNENSESFRLPTLDEWVFASRGGNKTKGFTYSGSNNANQVAVFNENSSGELAFVGTKKPNELGIYDMSGNVWEWVSDKYSDYERMNRGGDYRNEEDVCRVNNYEVSHWRRDHNPPTHRSLGLGFRIARNKID